MIRSMKWLFKIILFHEKKDALLETALMMLAGLLAPVSAVVLQHLIDEVTEGGLWRNPLILYLGILFSREGILALRRFCGARVLYSLGRELPEEIIQKFDCLPYFLFEQEESRDILEQIARKPAELLYELYQNIGAVIADVIAAAGYIAVVGQVHWLLSAGYLFFLLLHTGINIRAMKIMADLYDAQTGEERRMEYLGGLLSQREALTELKVFNSVSYIISLWRETADQVIGQRLRMTARAQLYFGAGNGAGVLWMGILSSLMVVLFTEGKADLGMFMAVMNSSSSLISLSGALSGYGLSLSRRSSAANQYRAFFAMPEIQENVRKPEGDKEQENHKAKKEEKLEEKGAEQRGIEFQNVSFCYPGGHSPVLQQLSFRIDPGETVALVGENGAGKSTILKLMCGLYEPDEGRILLDGRDIRELGRNEVRKKLGIAFQDFWRYWLTVRENVALGNLEERNQDDMVKKALNEALAGDLFEDLDSVLGNLTQEGRDLSGGQWQRLAVARALFGEKEYIILDEPTAAIDPVAESELYSSFQKSLTGRTGIIVSHRLASAAFTRRILVISGGKVAEEGSHQALLEQNGIYSRMWKLQSAWYGEGEEEK